jgi:hypothetical protein
LIGLKIWLKEKPRTSRITALAALILPVSSFYLRKNRKAGREEGEKSEYAIPFVSIRVVRGYFFFFLPWLAIGIFSVIKVLVP